VAVDACDEKDDSDANCTEKSTFIGCRATTVWMNYPYSPTGVFPTINYNPHFLNFSKQCCKAVIGKTVLWSHFSSLFFKNFTSRTAP
jgi:hypothetical protein